MSKSLKSLLVLAFLVVVIAGYYYKKSSDNKISDSQSPIVGTIDYSNNQKSKDEETVNWQNYQDPSGIFSLKYPESSAVNSDAKETKISTKVETIADLVKNGFAAEKEKEALENGKLGDIATGSFSDSNKIIMLDGGKATAKEYIIFADKLKCEVDMILNLIFYYSDKRVKISYQIDNFAVRVPADYLVASDKCENKLLNESRFFANLSTGKVNGELQTFYNDFDEIVKSIKIY